MSQSRALQLHITQMEEIRSILNSMKNLALIEIHKLGRFQTMQGQAVATIEQVALDFLSFYPSLPLPDTNVTALAILVGAERGFCGDFNDSLLKAMQPQTYAGMIAIGSRLHNRLADSPVHVVATMPGANVAEEVPAVLGHLIEIINNQQQSQRALTLTVIHHDAVQNHIVTQQIMPPFVQAKPVQVQTGNAPLLNVEPALFFSDLISHYLFAALHEIFYISLMAENHRRLQHLEAAVKHLDDDVVTLRRKSQVYRQEEITEEIEVILLNTENP
ncbi:MAG: F0F1 ATP synthase subunit gamma [Methylococcaceae bacterium]